MSEILLSIVIGLITGFITSLILHFTEKTQGVFLINTTDPNKDVWRIEFTIPLVTVPEHKIIRLRVIDESSRE